MRSVYVYGASVCLSVFQFCCGTQQGNSSLSMSVRVAVHYLTKMLCIRQPETRIKDMPTRSPNPAEPGGAPKAAWRNGGAGEAVEGEGRSSASRKHLNVNKNK